LDAQLAIVGAQWRLDAASGVFVVDSMPQGDLRVCGNEVCRNFHVSSLPAGSSRRIPDLQWHKDTLQVVPYCTFLVRLLGAEYETVYSFAGKSLQDYSGAGHHGVRLIMDSLHQKWIGDAWMPDSVRWEWHLDVFRGGFGVYAFDAEPDTTSLFPNLLVQGEWSHLALVQESGFVRMFLNGK